MTYAVWVDYPRLKVAGADRLREAMYYAYQYTDEGAVTVRHRNRIVAKLSAGEALRAMQRPPKPQSRVRVLTPVPTHEHAIL